MATFVDPRSEPVANPDKPGPRLTAGPEELTELHRLCRDNRPYDIERCGHTSSTVRFRATHAISKVCWRRLCSHNHTGIRDSSSRKKLSIPLRWRVGVFQAGLANARNLPGSSLRSVGC